MKTKIWNDLKGRDLLVMRHKRGSNWVRVSNALLQCGLTNLNHVAGQVRDN